MEFPVVFDEEEKIWSGQERRRIFNSSTSVGEIALYMMRSKPPTAVCQISDSEHTTLTYGTAITYAIRIAQHFKTLELSQDDIVSIVATNTTFLMPVAVACWMNCTPFQAIYPLHEENIVNHLLNITKPKIIFCDGLYYGKVKNCESALNAKIFTLCNHLTDVPKVEDLLEPTMTEQFFQPAKLKYGPDQTMGLYCSSGTTGLPKAVCVSNDKMLYTYGFINGTTIMFSFSTPDWGTGLLNLLHNTLNGCIRIITTKSFSPEYLMEIIIKYEVTFMGIGAYQATDISILPNFNKKNLKNIRFILMAGGHCPISTLERIRSQLTEGTFINGYATTECGALAGNLKNYKNNSVGRILSEIQIKILDQQTGEKLAHNQVGEICARVGSKWGGYYGDVKATEAVLDVDGWIRTGDLGYMDEENYLYLIDRCKDILKYKAMHYAPHEIEETIQELSGVLDACVFGVYDENFNDLAAAAVVKKPGSNITEDDVVEYVKQHQENVWKHLHYGVFFIDEIPRNTNGKVLRNKIKEYCLSSK